MELSHFNCDENMFIFPDLFSKARWLEKSFLTGVKSKEQKTDEVATRNKD